MKVQVVLLFAALAAVGAIDFTGSFLDAISDHDIHKKVENRTAEMAEDGIEGERYSRSVMEDLFGSRSYYTCDFIPNVSFFPEMGSPLPVYRCLLDSNEVLIATSSFHSATNPRDFVTRATVVLDNTVLNTVYPGTFRPTEEVLFRGVQSSNSFNSPVAINGLLILSTPNLKTGLLNYFNSEKYRCEFLPYVNFYVEQYGQLPSYKCIHGSNEVLISTTSFRTYNEYEYIHNVEISLNDAVLSTHYPGSFIQVISNKYRSVTGLDYAGQSVGINGLLPLMVY